MYKKTISVHDRAAPGEQGPSEALSNLAKAKKLKLDKLIDATGLCGEVDRAVFEITKQIKQELSEFTEFGGIFPYGSTVKGYGSKDKSDYDMDIIMIESSKNPRLGAEPKINDIEREYKNIGIQVSIKRFYFYLSDFQYELSQMNTTFSPVFNTQMRIASIICSAGRGKQINPLRQIIKNEILKLSQENQAQLLRNFVDSLMYREYESLPKIKERVAGFNQDDYLKARRKLWINRVKHVFWKNESNTPPQADGVITLKSK